ncbi:MAG TPA: LCP family protein [Streptosporangiaceae bacterium]|nr:LCP family protein [Streptosporangiaceae bacterium]
MSRYEDRGDRESFPATGQRRQGTLTRRPVSAGSRTGGPGSYASREHRNPSSHDEAPRRGQPRRATSAWGYDDDTHDSGGARAALLGQRPILRVLAVIGTVVVTGIAFTAYAAYRNVYDSINHVNVTEQMLGPRPPAFNGSTNILIIGSDSRSGLGSRYGSGIQGARSDTTLILHISPTHQHAYAISFPRDSMVPVYSCLKDGAGTTGQQAAPGQTEMLNSSFAYGGPACLWKTLEQSTHIRIDHFLEVDFTSFKQIVDDVGGVPVCLPFAINDPASKLHLTAGKHVVHGYQALAFVRERHIGLGSDLQRIQRQQIFLASLAQTLKNSGVLSSPTGLYHLIHDVAGALTTDSGLTVSQMFGIANSLKNLSTSSLRFISVPVVNDPNDPNRVDWVQPQASQLFYAIAHDSHLSKAAAHARPGRHVQTVATVSPGKVKLQVLNGSGVSGVAGVAATALTSKGFQVVGTGNATNFGYNKSVVEYSSPADLAAANTVQQSIADSQVQKVAGLPAGTVALVVGTSYSNSASGTSGNSGGTSRPSVTSVTSQLGGVAGNANICHDSSAFAGPDNPSMFGNSGSSGATGSTGTIP